MLVHRLLDVVFRSLDAVDAVRERLGQLRREPQPPSDWPTSPEASRAGRTVNGDDVSERYVEHGTLDTWEQRDSAGDEPTKKAPTKKAPTKKAPTKKAPTQKPPTQKTAEGAAIDGPPAAAKTPAKKASPKVDDAPASASQPDGERPVPAKKKRRSTQTTRPKPAPRSKKDESQASRKGSVDRLGKDFDSPRARRCAAFLAERGAPIVGEDAAEDNKKTLARVLWAIAAAEAAGVEEGLTAADVSALLSMSATLEVFSTNIGRTLRDESDLFVETTPDGRSKRYVLSNDGRTRAEAQGFMVG